MRDTTGRSDNVPEMEAADWESLSDEELLERKISKLGLRLEGTSLQPLTRQLYDELSAKGLVFHPPCHVGDEWFVPIGIPAIFIPFFLVNDRLRALERKMMLEVEGETPEWFMKLMRHEAAHAYSYAYKFQRRRKWQQTVRSDFARRNADHLSTAPVQPQLCRSSGRLVRAEPIRMKISLRHSRFGSLRDSTGARLMLGPRRCANWNTSMN